MQNLSGVLTALSTPFSVDETINDEALQIIIDRSIAAGVDGLVAGGSTGEFASLTGAERQSLIETVIERVDNRVPVIAQTGATTVSEAKRLSLAAENAGANVLMLVTPYYEPLSLEETKNYIKEVASAVQLPVMLYNIPGATGINLDIDTVKDLAGSLENIKYIKDSSADYEQGLRLIRYLKDDIGTFIGWDTYLYSALVEGAAGIMAGTANVIPEEIVAVNHLIKNGDLKEARQKWALVYPAIDSMLSEPFVAAVKAGLRMQGIPAGYPRQPMADISEPAYQKIALALRALGRKV